MTGGPATDPRGAASDSSLEVLAHGETAWVYVERPTPEVLERLGERYGLHPLHLSECLGRRLRPRVARLPGYLLLSLSVPTIGKLSRTTAAVGVAGFLLDGCLITVHQGDARPLVRLFREAQAEAGRREALLGPGPAFLLAAVAERAVAGCQQAVEALATSVQAAEETLAGGEAAEQARERVLLRREVATLARVLEANRAALAELAAPAAETPRPGPALAPHFAALTDRLTAGLDVLAGCRESLAGLDAAAVALAAERAGAAARLAATVLAATLPLLVLTTLFGVSLREVPLAAHPDAFELLLGALAVAFLAALYLLRRGRRL